MIIPPSLRAFEIISMEQWDKDTQSYDKKKIIKYDDLILPNRKTTFSAGYDFASTLDFTLSPNGGEILIPTGIKAVMRYDEFLSIFPRSGMAFKYYIRLANSVGIIDHDYYGNPDNEGHIWIKLRNEGTVPFSANIGDGIAQGIFQKYLLCDEDVFRPKRQIDPREGGLGSTDKKKPPKPDIHPNDEYGKELLKKTHSDFEEASEE